MKAEWCMQISDVERKSHYLKGVKADTVVPSTKVTRNKKRRETLRQSDGVQLKKKAK